MNWTRLAAAGMIPALVVALAACGPERTAQKSGPKIVNPKPAEPTIKAGSLAPAALGDARCAPDGNGTWSAAGTLKNGTKKPASYDVIVQLGAADGQPSTAYVKRVSDVPAGKTADFTVSIIEDTVPTGPCHVQVRTASDEETGEESD